MAITALGIDLAKNVFALHGVDEAGQAVLVRASVSRAAAVPDRFRSVQRCASLGARVYQARSQGTLDGTQICCAVSAGGQVRQK